MRLSDIFGPKGNKEPEEEQKTVNIDGFILDARTWEVIGAPEGLTVYNIPKEATGISSSALYIMGLSAVEINFHNDSKITELPERLFYFSPKLESIQLPNTLRRLNNIVSTRQFYRGVTYNIPTSLEVISAEEVPKRIERVVLGDKLRRVSGGWLATHNAYLKYLEIPGTLEDKTVPSLSNVQALETLVIHEGLTKMGSISGCNSLTDVYIPSSLTEFSLGEDDYRAIAGINEETRRFDSEEIRNRKIKLHKIINGQEVVFEVSRKDFSSFTVTDKEIIFSGSGKFVIPLESVMGNDYYLVDIGQKKIEKKLEDDKKMDSTLTDSFDSKKTPPVVTSEEEPSIFVKASGDSIVIPNENGSASSPYKKILETLKEIKQIYPNSANMTNDSGTTNQQILDEFEGKLRR